MLNRKRKHILWRFLKNFDDFKGRGCENKSLLLLNKNKEKGIKANNIEELLCGLKFCFFKRPRRKNKSKAN